MEFLIGQIIKAVIFPPGIFILLILIALWLLKHNIAAAKRTLLFTASGLYLLSLPIVAELLMTPLEPYPALKPQSIQNTGAGAIVILAAGRFTRAREYNDEDVSGDNTFGRLRYGARLHELSQLPVLLTGGLADENHAPLAQVMAKDLLDNFSIKARWLETNSRNTAENAIYSYKILSDNGINHIFLVTDAWHMRRAVPIFEQQGFVVTPAPTRFKGLGNGPYKLEVDTILPSAKALKYSYYALHEWVGAAWYKIRY